MFWEKFRLQTCRLSNFPDLPFLGFSVKTKENHQKHKDFSLLRTPGVPGNEEENAQKSKAFLANEKRKED